MSKDLLQEVQNKSITKKVPDVKPGYTVEIDLIIREGSKQRVQKFRGLVLAVTGVSSNTLITVRKISYGVGVEKKIPVHSPNVGNIKIIKTEPTRRSKLYFMRDRVGKSAMRINKGKAVFMTDTDKSAPEEIAEEVTPMEVEAVQPEAKVTETTEVQS